MAAKEIKAVSEGLPKQGVQISQFPLTGFGK